LRHQKELAAPFGALLVVLRRLAGTLDSPLPAQPTAADPAIDLLLALAKKTESSLSERLQALEDELPAARQKLQELLEQIGGDAGQAMTTAALAEQSVSAGLAQARKDAIEASTLDQRLDAVEQPLAALTTLKQAFRGNRFKQYVLEHRAARLLDLASNYLFEMSHEFKFTPSFDIDVVSNHTKRPAVSLSGGEKFMASLALSLAVVEQAAIGGAKITSLFLDEGFDALDPTCLEEAMEQLHSRARKGRAIFMITHLKDAAAYANDSYMVERGAGGSVVRRYDPSEEAVDAAGLVAVFS
jgi:DNA repair exonuclease SbcCD ATPase subunit